MIPTDKQISEGGAAWIEAMLPTLDERSVRSNDAEAIFSAGAVFARTVAQARIAELERVLELATKQVIILSVDGLIDEDSASIINECEKALNPALKETRL